MNIIYPSEFNRAEHAFLFNAELKPPLILVKKLLRSDQEYDNDSIPEKSALNVIKSISERFDGYVYSVISNQDLVKVDSFRAKKSILPPQSGVKSLQQRKISITLPQGVERQGVVALLQGFDYTVKDKLVLNFVNCLFVLSKQDIDAVFPTILSWFSGNISSSFAFNSDAIGLGLSRCTDMALMRYFPPDNGRSEMLIIVGNQTFVFSKIQPLLDHA